MKVKGLFFSTVFLALINVFIRILGFGYRIILVRLIGTEGLGLFELINPVIILVSTLVGSGVPIAIIRLVSKSLAKDKQGESFKVIEYVSFIMVVFSLLISVVLFIGAPFIANNILKDERLLTPIYIFAPAILFPALAAILRGYFYGEKNVVPPALSQLGEQTSRMAVVVILLSMLYPFSEERAISISVVGNVFGELVGICILFIFFSRARKKFLQNNTLEKVSFVQTATSFGTIALPITLSRVISSVLRVATSIVVPGRLVVSGLDNSAALSFFGEVNGMVMPLLFIPFTLTSALVMNLIPRISDAVERKNKELLHNYIDKTFHIAFLVGIPVSAIFAIYADEIFQIIYRQPSGVFLFQLSISTLFLCVYQIATSILQGIGKQNVSTMCFVFGMSIQFILTYILVGNPNYRINGYIFSFLLSFFIISVLEFLLVFYFTKDKPNFKKWILIPTLATLSSIVASKLSYDFLQSFFNYGLAFFASMMLMGVMYLLVLLLTKNIKHFFNKAN